MRGEGLAKALWFMFFCWSCWPFIGAADRAVSVLGVPSLFLYLFLGWGVLVAALALAARKLGD
ncbi:MAG: hypothetical protein ACM319_07380 [Deltaproteobacteria bacterium]|nr:hypothetical protein [Candidatus Deferrimicrobiaceae bacterium]